MPIPSPRKGESRKDFEKRCMSDGVMKREYPEGKQRFRICSNSWRDKKKAEQESQMPDKSHVLDAIAADPWLITEDMLQTIVGIAERTQGDAAEMVEFKAPDKVEETGAKIRDGVGIVDIKGPIFRYANLFTQISGATSVAVMSRQFQELLDNSSVKTILLNIDSPGGQANGIHELAEAIYAARQQKKIVAYVGGSGTSAAYWLASAAEMIAIDETAILGSIGVVLSVRKKDDSKIEFVSSSSPNKRPDLETDEGKKSIIKILDDLADVFISKVARNRGVDVKVVENDFGRGGLLVGANAVAAKLADKLGSFELTLGGSKMPITKEELIAKQPELAEELRKEGRKETAEELTTLGAENVELKKANLMQKLTTKVGKGHASMLLAFHDKLTDAEIDGIADTIATLQATINDLGKEEGDLELEEESIPDAQVDKEVKKIMDKEGLSQTDAYVEWTKRNPEKAAKLK